MSAFVLQAAARCWTALLALAVLLGLGTATGSAQVASQRIAAIVNDDVITSQDLSERLNLVLATSGVPSEPETQRRLMQQVLRGYIDEKLQLQEAERLRLQVGEDEIDRALTTLAQRNRLDLESFKQALAERNIDERVLRSQIRGQIAWAKVVNRELRPRVAVTQGQVELALKDFAASSEEVELALSEILLPVDGPGQEAQVLRDAAGLVQTLREGADFAALAQQVSVSSTAEEGGDLGWVRPSMIMPELRDRLAGLPEGGVSDPIASPVGVHIFKIRERRDPRAPSTRLIVQRVSLAQVLLPLAPDATPAAVQAAEARARELMPRLTSCAAIDAYAERTDSEGSGTLGWLALTDLPQGLREFVAGLEPGTIAEPIRGPLGVQLLMVCDREGREETVAAPPPPPPPTPEEMRQRLEDEQIERLATRYLRELRKDAFIDVRVGA